MLHFLLAGGGIQWIPPRSTNLWAHVPPLILRLEGEGATTGMAAGTTTAVAATTTTTKKTKTTKASPAY